MNIVFVEELINLSQIYDFSIWVYHVEELFLDLQVNSGRVCAQSSLFAEWKDHWLLITQISFRQNLRLLFQLLEDFWGLFCDFLFVDDQISFYPGLRHLFVVKEFV